MGRSPATSCDISVVIVSYNTREMTLACVESVKRHAEGLGIQVVVVDNCSSDGSSQALRSHHPDITVIDAPANHGFAQGNVLGFRHCLGRYILLLNPDAEIYPQTLLNAVRYMDEHKQVGVVGARVFLPDGSQQSSMIRFPNLWSSFSNIFLPVSTVRRTRLAGDTRYAGFSNESINSVDAVSGCFMLTRRSVIEQVGSLDNRFFMYGEELEWCWRIRNAGWDIVYHPDVRILHHGGASTRNLNSWKAVEMMRGQLLFFRLCRGKTAAYVAALMMVARDLLRIWPLALIAIIRRNRSEDLRAVVARLLFGLKSLFRPPSGQVVKPLIRIDGGKRSSC